MTLHPRTEKVPVRNSLSRPWTWVQRNWGNRFRVVNEYRLPSEYGNTRTTRADRVPVTRLGRSIREKSLLLYYKPDNTSEFFTNHRVSTRNFVDQGTKVLLFCLWREQRLERFLHVGVGTESFISNYSYCKSVISSTCYGVPVVGSPETHVEYSILDQTVKINSTVN